MDRLEAVVVEGVMAEQEEEEDLLLHVTNASLSDL